MSGAARRLRELCHAHGLGSDALGPLEALVEALGLERDPPTTVRMPAEAADAHIADSLSGLEVPALRSAGRVVDLGPGAGFPGLPLAVALPTATFDLVEANRRSCAVMERLVRAAGIPNARVVRERVETWGAENGRERYDLATARAVAPLPVLVEYAAPLLRVGGALVVWRGAREQEDEDAGGAAAATVGLAPREVLTVTPFPGAHSRHLHVFEKAGATPERFPRRPGIAAKRPLA